MLDSFEPSVDALSPFTELVEERPEGDHENPVVALDFLDIFASLDTWSRRGIRNWCKSMHIDLFRRDHILSTNRPVSIGSPPINTI